MQLHYKQVDLAGKVLNADLAGSIGLDKLAENVLQADGGQAFTADMPAGGFKITDLAAPVDDNDAARKKYVVDSIAAAAISSYDFKASCRATADRGGLPPHTAAGSGVGKTLTADTNDVLPAQDGVTLIATNRVVVYSAAAAHADSGIYTVTSVGEVGVSPWVLTRATDADSDAEVTPGMWTQIEEGTAYADSAWRLVTDAPVTVDTTALDMAHIPSLDDLTGGDGIVKSGNSIAVDLKADVGLVFDGGELTTKVHEATGLTFGGDGLGINHDDSTITAVGNQLKAKDAGITKTQLNADVAGNGISGGAGTALTVAPLTPRPSITVAAGGVSAAVLQTQVASGTLTADEDDEDSGINLTLEPSGNGHILVHVNGILVEVGDGVKTKDCYFTDDAGTSARAFNAIVATDELYWNAVIAGYQLDPGDEVTIVASCLV